MKVFRFPKKEEWDKLLKRPLFENTSVDLVVNKVLQDIKNNGDKAVQKYTEQFDKVTLSSFVVHEDEFIKADKKISNELKESIEIAITNITKFHEPQKAEIKKITTTEGVICWQKSVAIEKVGLYIPGGTAPLFSTVLMLAIPAKIAGCNKIVLCSPPGKSGEINPAILYAARISGITQVFKIGGIQAIGAMAYGTETIPKVYKIFGPGNQYVTAAKQIVARNEVAIDMPAGPSEVAVMADAGSNPSFIASDLLSQAEHGTDSQVMLVTTSDAIVQKVQDELTTQLQSQPRAEIAKKALENSRIILVKDKNEMVDIINEYAPEHLIISTNDAGELAEKIVNAGSVFIGEYTPESAGDYASGTNHTLPTYGYAKAYNGVNLDNYVKKITFQKISPEGLKNIGKAIEIMAQAEKLIAHKNAVSLRLNKIRKDEKN